MSEWEQDFESAFQKIGQASTVWRFLAHCTPSTEGRQASGFPCPICQRNSLSRILDEQARYGRLLLECAQCYWKWWVEIW